MSLTPDPTYPGLYRFDGGLVPDPSNPGLYFTSTGFGLLPDVEHPGVAGWISVTPTVGSRKSVRLAIEVHDPAPAPQMMSVFHSAAGARDVLLGAVAIPAVSTVLVDATASLNRPVVWSIVLADGTEVDSAPLVVAAEWPILSNPWSGDASDVLVVDVDDELTMRARVEVLTIENSTQPVPVSDVPTGYYGRLQLLTTSADAAESVAALSRLGHPMLLRCSCGQHPDRWLQPTGDLSTTRLVKRVELASRMHLWEECIYLPGAPWPTIPAAFDTLQDLADAVPTDLGDIAETWLTLAGIAETDLAGGI